MCKARRQGYVRFCCCNSAFFFCGDSPPPKSTGTSLDSGGWEVQKEVSPSMVL